MSKVAVVFWSGTGNAEAMAEQAAAGARAARALPFVFAKTLSDTILSSGTSSSPLVPGLKVRVANVRMRSAIYRTDEMADLVFWMRTYNETAEDGQDLRFYGFDMQRVENCYR